METSAYRSPFAPIATIWKERLRIAREVKKSLFGDDAEEAMRFYNSDHSFLWDAGNKRGLMHGEGAEGMSAPAFAMTYNVVAELVQLFGPSVYHRNPYRLVTPRDPIALPEALFVPPELLLQEGQIVEQTQMAMAQGFQPDPMALSQLQYVQQMVHERRMAWASEQATNDSRFAVNKTVSSLLQSMLNYTPNELNLKRHSRQTIDEALIKGMGIMLTEYYETEGVQGRLVGTFHKSIDDYNFDPDVTDRADASWISLDCCEPRWKVERDYRLEPGSLKGCVQSRESQAINASDKERGTTARLYGTNRDLIRYTKIWSKTGMGVRLKGFEDKGNKAAWESIDDEVGDYCYIVVAENCSYPLNLGPGTEEVTPEELFHVVQWPIPTWADNGAWPVSEFAFHEVPGQAWPMSHIKPAMGELKFIDFCMSFLANKVRTSMDDVIGVLKAAGEELKDQLTNRSAGGYKLIEIESTFGKDIKDVISVIQMPPFNGSIFQVITWITDKLEKRLGLTELAYGQSSRQYRSAAEAEVKQANYSVRPDDMANTVEDAMTEIARKEAFAARWGLQGEDIAPLMGETAARIWDQLVLTGDITKIVREYEYRIEANSARKPNRDKEIDTLQQAVQFLLPVYQQNAMQTGDVSAMNEFLRRYYRSAEMDERGLMLIQPPPPMMMPPPDSQAPPEEGPPQ